jgi:DNA-binding CsgD family transcriptional regulator
LLAQAIRDVMAGKVWLYQEQLQTALDSELASTETRSGRFTERERQVLSLVFEGLANKEIAGRIKVSESSVKATLQQLFSKTGVRTRSQLVRIVLEQHRDQLWHGKPREVGHGTQGTATQRFTIGPARNHCRHGEIRAQFSASAQSVK